MSKKSQSSFREKLIWILPPAVFLMFTLVFYGPLSLYLPNSGELWFSVGDVLRCILPVSLLVLAVPVLIALVLPEKASRIFSMLVFGMALGFYVQGNLMNMRYGSGVMDGTEVKWQYYTKYAILNTGVWILCIALPFLVCFLLGRPGAGKDGAKAGTGNNTAAKNAAVKNTRIFVMAAALFLTAVQIPALIVQALNYEPYERNLSITQEGMFDLSDQKNVIFLVLDTVDELYYDQFLEAYPDYEEELDGFTRFDNTLASGARTIVAIPSMLSGRPFRRETVYSEYLDQIYAEENPLSKMYDRGVSVGIYSQNLFFADSAVPYVSNFTNEGQEVGSYGVLTEKLYKMTFSRYFPHLLKKYVWFNTAEYSQAMEDMNLYKQNDAKFFKNYRKNGFSYASDSPCAFRMYHLLGAHSPYTLSADGTESEEADVVSQTAAGLFAAAEMLRDLKESGHYDDTTVIITADHGDKGEAQQPFLLVKRAGDTGPCRTVHAPASLFDLAVLLEEELDLPRGDYEFGEDLFGLSEDEERERHFFKNVTGSSRVQIVEYVTTEDAGDPDAMEVASTFEDAQDAEPYVLGTELTFAQDATGNRYCVEGFGVNSGFRTILRGPHAILEIPIADLPSGGNLAVHIGLHNLSEKRDTIILANGTEVFHEKMDAAHIKAGLDFTVPVESVADADGVLTIELQFPELPEDQMELDVQQRKKTLSFVSMVIRKK